MLTVHKSLLKATYPVDSMVGLSILDRIGNRCKCSLLLTQTADKRNCHLDSDSHQVSLSHCMSVISLQTMNQQQSVTILSNKLLNVPSHQPLMTYQLTN